ncbi:hypothetical protein GCM10010211_65650 [Streptomyces albospinus]|uniref:Uncharacterized protein n=1 Tax=Streptomyces albospinus TaxID=285515 RepID=A0ABQ2VJS8_9ACTN|nr:hypothetical protein [Streptomyces albospinus]GGU89964.1 hypothetical protein GCM10010211_65650 [Streptomyces albospinus]
MKLAIRTGLVAAVTAAAFAVVAPPAGATTAKGDQAANEHFRATAAAVTPAAVGNHAMGARLAANPNTIKAAAYNQARSILAKAGSDTAAKSHPVHGTGDVPVRYGTSLLAGSRDEFRSKDRNVPKKKSGMSIPHYTAIHDAARTMGIDRW